MPIKNMIYKTKIESINNLGYGVCRIDGMVCFVKGGVTGDILNVKVIKVNKNYCIGKIEEFFDRSSYRIEQSCPVFKQCGGCCFRHITYTHELELKKSFVEAEFKKANVDVKVNDVIFANTTERYRNKAQYPVNFENEIGFFSEKSHKVCNNTDCVLQPVVFADIINIVREHMNKYNIKGYDEVSGKGLLRHIYIRQGKSTGEINVCLVINGNEFVHSHELVENLKRIDGLTGVLLNINKKNTNVILGEKYVTLFGREYIDDILCSLHFRISPASFYQVNHDCAELLYNKVIEYAQECGKKRITDLYCGTGTIGLCVANRIKDCSLIGIDIVPEAITNAKANAKTNGIDNAVFICADSTDTQDDILKKTDVLILDPPRKGITKELADKIKKSEIENVIYVSCSPDTLARDVKYFNELGYKCNEVTPFDMFPRTSHVESVVLITRCG